MGLSDLDRSCWGVPYRGDTVWIIFAASSGSYRLNRFGIGLLGFSRRKWVFMFWMV